MENDRETSNTRDFVTTSEAAEALGVSYYTVYEYIKEKRLVADMVGGIYMIPKKAVQEFRAKPTGRVRTHPPLWRKYRAGAKVRGMDIRVRVLAGQQKRLIEKLEAILEAQRYLFPGTMQRYIFEEEAEPKYIVISLNWKDTEMPDESVIQKDLKPLQAELADTLDWDTSNRTSKERSIMRTQSEDTSPEMERVQIKLIRKASPAKRFAIMQAWIQLLIEANKQRILKDHPDASEEDLSLIFVARHYGQALADGLRADMARRRQ